MSLDADRIPAIYERHAQAFDRLRTRALFEKAWLDRFLGAMPPRRTVLDLGCGSGEPLARYLVEAGCTITGVDTSPGLLALGRGRFPGHTWLEADMRTVSLGGEFDGLLAWDSFFHLTPDDQRAMFAVFRAHLREGGALMFTSGPEAGVRTGEFEGEPLYHASLAQAEYRMLLQGHGFEVLAHMAEDAGCGGHTVWLARRN